MVRQFRRSAALWVTPVAVVLSVLNLRPALATIDVYWLAASAQAAGSLIIVGPLAAACGAWEGARYRYMLGRGTTPARGPVAVALWNLVPVAVLAAVVFGVSFAVAAHRVAGAPGLPDPRFTALAFALTMAFAIAGYALGGVLAPVYAVPTMLIGVLLWLIYPRAFEPFWIRHLTGNFYQSCCSVDADINPRTLIAPVLLAAGVAIGGALIVWRRRPAVVLLAAVMFGGAATGAWGVVREVGPSAAIARHSGPACHTSHSLEICIWREHVDRRDETRRTLEEAVRRLSAAGVSRPRRLTEGPVTDRDTWSFVAKPESSPADIVWSVVVARIPPMPACAEHQPWQNTETETNVAAWLAHTAGMTRSDIETRVPLDSATVQRVHKRSRDEQLRWLKRNLHALVARCDADSIRALKP